MFRNDAVWPVLGLSGIRGVKPPGIMSKVACHSFNHSMEP